MINGLPLFSHRCSLSLDLRLREFIIFTRFLFYSLRNLLFLINYHFRGIVDCDRKNVCGRAEAELIIGWEREWERERVRWDGKKTEGLNELQAKECLGVSIYYTSIACWLFALESLIKNSSGNVRNFNIKSVRAMLEQSEGKERTGFITSNWLIDMF